MLSTLPPIAVYEPDYVPPAPDLGSPEDVEIEEDDGVWYVSGPWMDRLRQFLAFPMYASAVWMIWVLTQQTGADGVLYALGGMILIAFAIWLLRLGNGASVGTWVRRGLAAAAVLLAFAATLKLDDSPATAASPSSVIPRAPDPPANSGTSALVSEKCWCAPEPTAPANGTGDRLTRIP